MMCALKVNRSMMAATSRASVMTLPHSEKGRLDAVAMEDRSSLHQRWSPDGAKSDA